MTTAQKQAYDIAQTYIQGSERERKIILSFFQGEEREIFLKGVGLIHLFSDQDFYNSVRDSLKDRLIKELYA